MLADIVDADSELAVLTDPFLCMGLSKWIHAYSGDEEMGVKGTKYWKDRIDFYSDEISKVGDVYVNKLNEQRNSFTFILSIFVSMFCSRVSWHGFGFNFWRLKTSQIIENLCFSLVVATFHKIGIIDPHATDQFKKQGWNN